MDFIMFDEIVYKIVALIEVKAIIRKWLVSTSTFIFQALESDLALASIPGVDFDPKVEKWKHHDQHLKRMGGIPSDIIVMDMVQR